ncbi:uncharacterized protein LOC141607530 [Silene latifolia]|uniref:uncharacterized protein LOC141607530 n=1 Tax=Silene latifolia TaxID=37657 RepID=UPI003D775F74
MYSWLRKSFTRTNKEDTQNLKTPKSLQNSINKLEEEEYYGVTNHLIEFIKTLNFDSFKNFPLPEEENDAMQTTTSGIRVDLSEWQQQHAIMILSKVKELSQLRYTVCPRHLKERQFWRIYFSLVKNHLTEYELRAIQHDKIRRMATEADEKPSDTNGIELEMTEPKHMRQLPSP